MPADRRPLIIRESNPEKDKQTALRAAGRAADRVREAERQRRAAMWFASTAGGASLREIAAATGVPHTTVKRILDRGELQ